ncbi:MAG: aminotransferase class I/II-fold pyridoxal phosphate-dependent enzyme [Eubacteriales bacterium]|nr:aminotransferase class I/II-fold pyridoxal phosphate-dependent enzyme [Eubacteriales bacterium]
MKFDFTSILDRKGKDAVAVDEVGRPGGRYPAPKEGFDVIPMWIADMNFPVVPAVQEAMIARAKEPTFGYFDPRQEYFDAIIGWQKSHNGVEGLTAANIGYENGVLGGVVSALNVMCSRGDKVLVHSPTYVGFTHALGDNGYDIVHSALRLDENGVWRMDFEDMERKIVENKIHAAVFCSPHNPTGRVWERWEIERAMEVYKKHAVLVVSDEIWSDILLEGYTHVPTQSVSPYARLHTVALYAPSKTFNLAGLVGSYHIIYNPWLKDRVDRESRLSSYNSMNVMSMHALIGAYSDQGAAWAAELRQVITGNVDFACDFIARHFAGVKVSRPQGTYMLFLDCGDWCAAHGKTMDELLQMGWDVGVVWQDGRAFHGKSHIRMNLALPLSRVQEAFERLDKYVF